MDPGLVIWKDIWLEIVMVRRLGDQMEVWSGGQKSMLLGKTGGSGVRECVDRVLGGIGG